MPRGLWRMWETKDGADIWSARVEDAPGQWQDLSQSEYRRLDLAPSFWDLPLQEDYLESVAPRNLEAEAAHLRQKFMLPAILVLMLAFCAIFVIYVAGYALLAKLSLVH